ncbi:unnamed protein product [Ranitomeya imitator]|uniref:TGF-beta family profile domain-containing protein n=1 Tax=Ranitomeya imitator TaxID=111125 RepID=A0ABN9LA40_9NEOB|nr:unnamed protein product [Ranitomeya imitator]
MRQVEYFASGGGASLKTGGSRAAVRTPGADSPSPVETVHLPEPRRTISAAEEENFINFRELTWTQYWIIEPAGYNAYRCSGSCRQPHSQALKYSYGERICTVAESSPLPVMYLVKKGDYTEIEVAEFPNMIVERCSCTADNISII